MGIHTSILEQASPQIDLFPARGAAITAPSSVASRRAYAELAARLFGDSGRSVVAFVSASRGEGVTYTVRGLAAELPRAGRSVVVLDGDLRRLRLAGLRVPERETGSPPPILGAPLGSESEQEPAVLAGLRDHYDGILLDCGSLQDSVSLLRVASAADGVVLVVEAGRTAKEQVERCARVIREARGTLIGFVLNKRHYPVPGWLYRML
jgi:Mrp family chromosome partitioning ATPase